MNLAVFGATGGVGRKVVTQALDAGHHVIAYVRNPTKLDVTHPNLTVVAGFLSSSFRTILPSAASQTSRRSETWIAQESVIRLSTKVIDR